tara:strand:- start:920 stop:1852 length:933 start_codon:yes stop_codon:yes gene_type:complete
MISQSIPCPATLIPTKAEITNAFSKIAQMPSRLELEGLSLELEGLSDEADKIRDEAGKIRDVLDDLKKPFSAYYPDFKGIEKPEIEWEFAVTRFLQDFNVYVPVTMMDIISKVVPIEFTVNVAGLDIDLKSMLTSDGKIALRDTIREEIDSVKNFLPQELKNFQGINGVEIPELQVEVSTQFIHTKLQNLATGNVFSGVNAVLGKFELTKIKMPAVGDFDIASALGGEIDETIVSLERTQQRIGQTIADFKELNATTALKKVIEKLPLSDIGLSALTGPLSLDCCGFFKIIGVPTSVNLPDTSINVLEVV